MKFFKRLFGMRDAVKTSTPIAQSHLNSAPGFDGQSFQDILEIYKEIKKDNILGAEETFFARLNNTRGLEYLINNDHVVTNTAKENLPLFKHMIESNQIKNVKIQPWVLNNICEELANPTYTVPKQSSSARSQPQKQSPISSREDQQLKEFFDLINNKNINPRDKMNDLVTKMQTLLNATDPNPGLEAKLIKAFTHQSGQSNDLRPFAKSLAANAVITAIEKGKKCSEGLKLTMFKELANSIKYMNDKNEAYDVLTRIAVNLTPKSLNQCKDAIDLLPNSETKKHCSKILDIASDTMHRTFKSSDVMNQKNKASFKDSIKQSQNNTLKGSVLGNRR